MPQRIIKILRKKAKLTTSLIGMAMIAVNGSLGVGILASCKAKITLINQNLAKVGKKIKKACDSSTIVSQSTTYLLKNLHANVVLRTTVLR